ncbi:hypothetical protein AAG906_025886 [Vitis piasezkii]
MDSTFSVPPILPFSVFEQFDSFRTVGRFSILGWFDLSGFGRIRPFSILKSFDSFPVLMGQFSILGWILPFPVPSGLTIFVLKRVRLAGYSGRFSILDGFYLLAPGFSDFWYSSESSLFGAGTNSILVWILPSRYCAGSIIYRYSSESSFSGARGGFDTRMDSTFSVLPGRPFSVPSRFDSFSFRRGLSILGWILLFHSNRPIRPFLVLKRVRLLSVSAGSF